MFLKSSIVYFILFYKRVSLLKSISFIYFHFNTQDSFTFSCECKMSKRKQQTLGYFGSTKKWIFSIYEKK